MNKKQSIVVHLLDYNYSTRNHKVCRKCCKPIDRSKELIVILEKDWRDVSLEDTATIEHINCLDPLVKILEVHDS